MNPKYILTDIINEAIIFIGEDLAVANQLKLGLVDTQLFVVHVANPSYNLILEDDLFVHDKHFFIKPLTSYRPIELPDHMKYPVYLERRNLVRIRKPLMEQLMRHCAFGTYLCSPTIWPGLENNLEFALKDCDIESNTYSNSVKEYAFINNLENYHAYREIKLQVDNIHSMKLRVYAYMKYFVDKVNQVTTEQERDNLSVEMANKLLRDAMM